MTGNTNPINVIKFFLLFLLIGLMSCKTSNDLTNKNEEIVVEESEKKLFNDKVMITANAEVTHEPLEKNYSQYGLKYVGLNSKKQNKMVFSFDTSTISNKKLLALLNKDNNVIKAESLYNINPPTTVGKSSKKQSSRLTK